MSSSGAVTPEARVLLGRLAAAINPLPSTGPVVALANLLSALGLTDQTTPLPQVALSVDAVQRLLLDPVGELKTALGTTGAAAAAAGALRQLLGDTTSTGTQVMVSAGGVSVGVDLAAASSAMSLTVAPATALSGGPSIEGSLQVSSQGSWSGSLSIGPASSTDAYGLPVLEVQLDGAAPTVAINFPKAPGGLPDRVVLLPRPATGQIAGAGAAIVEAAAAAGVQALVSNLREQVTAAARSQVDPALALLGLLSGNGSSALVPLPFGLVSDPAGFARNVLGSGGQLNPDQAASLVDAVRGAIGLASAPHGALPLAPGVQLLARPGTTGGLQLGLSFAPTTGTPTTGTSTTSSPTAQVQLGLMLPPGAPPVPQFQATLGPPGGAISLQLGLGGAGLSALLHTASGDVPLLPSCPGLGSLVQAVGQEALPFLLSTLESSGPAPLPAVLGGIRGALGLGQPTFDANELRTLCANPAGELVRRLVAAGPSALSDLANLLPTQPGTPPTLPAPWDLNTAASVQVSYGKQSLKVDLSGNPAVFTLDTSISFGIAAPAITVTLDATADSSGLRQLKVTAGVDSAHPLQLGPLSLAPVLEVDVGSQVSPGTVSLGLAWPGTPGPQSAVLMVALSSPPAVSFQTPGSTAAHQPDPMVLVTNLLVPAVADLALSQPQVEQLLNTEVGGTTIESLLQHVLITSASAPVLDPALLSLTDLPQRLATLIGNLAPVATATVADNLVVAIAKENVAPQGELLGVSLTVQTGQRAEIVSGSLSIGLEAADDWVSPPQAPPGLSVLFLSSTAPVAPVINVEGLGLRFYRSDGPLLDAGAQIGSVALYTLLRVATTSGNVATTDGGVAIQLSDLAVPVAGASGGQNSVAQGILGNAQQAGGSNNSPLRPSFSPELALQKRQGNSSLQWALTAGPGSGPWILPIDQSFGPLRVDNVGFGVDQAGGQVSAVRVLISGGISLAGLSLDVDDLSVGAQWPGPTPLTNPGAWTIDLDGLDVAYSGGGISLVGGLRRRDNPSLPGDPPDYVGVLSATVGPYGLTAFAGYGQFPSPTGPFTSLFVFAAIDAPIGGPPAFFVTGLAGGAGINRALVLPTSLNDLSTFPLIAALDPNSNLAADPSGAMDLLSTSFPPQQGTFWFAAGVSFTSFALIDVSAVVAVEVGNGFMLTLLGLATAALPTPALPLAQIQLALMAEFSTSAGLLEVLAQLTDQSYLLDPDCRLTGGFAYVSWFSPNPNAGQFVVTLGGYNPSFHHDGYPDVPRVGYRWCIGDVLTISGQTYFALTSEAIMAGTNFTAALTLGPAWASLTLGVDAIVYFDPFKFSAHAYAAIAAGITFSVDLLFGTITVSLSFHLGADVLVEGPSIHGSAKIDLDVTSVTIAFGSSTDGSTPTLDWTTFANKYLTAKGDAQPQLSAAPASGMLTPGSSPAPDGSVAQPWLLLPEFSLSVATSAAVTFASVSINPADPFPPAPGASSVSAYQTTGTVAIAPMGVGAIDSYLGITLTSVANETLPAIVFAATPGPPLSVALTTAPMPKGVWAPQLPSGTVPSGDTITAGSGLTLSGRAAGRPGFPSGQLQPG